MNRAIRIFLGFLIGALAGGLLGLAWGWIVLLLKAGGIDYPELNMLTRTIQWMAVADGVTGAALSVTARRGPFLWGWGVGVLARLALAVAAARVAAGINYSGPFLWVFAAAVVIPPLAGLASARWLGRRKSWAHFVGHEK